ncbi:NACHT and WD repeat domain-containing protein [Streptomyces sp. NBC_00582]|uniref:NACHT and WD repeat domain-containing protein n=1 Tax=Streptomyces sp. NBC_00582 TaxID=2975783 RepID=UPI002E8150F2|nr:WD40 repeat domain-containing protein [Streptomyces sp. NBC_00582]
MTAAGRLPPHREKVRLEAHASDRARIYQARRDLYLSERDLHLHYEDGVRSARRVHTAEISQECPYPGLAAFSTEQAQWFFGRDRLVAKLLVRLDACLAVGGALVVVAPSGAGKSSLLKAGLLAELARGALPGSAHWPHVWMTPTAHPLAALRSRLSDVTGSGRKTSENDSDSPLWQPAALRRALAAGGNESAPQRPLVLVVDQLEELFTLCADEHERRNFLDAVLGLTVIGPNGEPPIGLVVFGLRSDFYTQCAAHPRLLDAVERNQVIVGPLSRTGVREAILHPSRTVGLDVEPGLVPVLMRDLGTPEPGDEAEEADQADAYEIGRLPLLAHALRATWLRRAGHALTVEGYEATGGIAHSVTVEADRCFDQLDAQARKTAQHVFLRLIKFGDGTHDTRRPVRYTELLGEGARSHEVAEVIEAFTRGRLLTREQETVTITHEVLLRAWPRLREWIEAHRSQYMVRQRLDEAADAWEESGHDPGLLYRGHRLDEARTLADDESTGALGPAVSAFLTASARQRHRTRRIRQGVIAGLSVLAVLAALSAALAFQQRDTAQRERNTAILGEITAEADQVRASNPSLAAQLDLVAHRMSPAASTGTRLLSAQNIPLAAVLAGHTDHVNAVGFSPDGHLLASGGGDGTIRLWNTVRADHPTALGNPLRGAQGAISALAFSPRGNLLAATGEDGTVRMWDLSRPTSPDVLSTAAGKGDGPLKTLAFSPDGRTLAGAGHDGDIRLWDAADPGHLHLVAKPLPASAGEVNGLAFSPNGKLLASGGTDPTVRLWQVTDRRHPSEIGRTERIPFFAGHEGSAQAVAFSPDSRILAAAGSDQNAHRWNITNPAEPKPLDGIYSNNVVNTVAFSPTSPLMAYGGDDNTIWLENVTAPTHVRDFSGALNGHSGHVLALAFDPRGRMLASAGADHSVRIWTIPRTILTGHTSYVDTVALSPDGHLLASGSEDNTVRLWNVAHPTDPHPVSASIHGDTPYPNWVTFSPDGKALAVAAGPDVQLWDVTRPARPTPLGKPLHSSRNNFLTVAYTPDGRTLAGGNGDGTVKLWDVSDPSHPSALGPSLDSHAGQINRLAISPDGRTLAAVADQGSLRLWDITRPAQPAPTGSPLQASADPLQTVAFSPDSRFLAASGNDATIRLWNLADRTHPAPAGSALTGHKDTVYTLAFSPDGHTLVSGSFDQTIRLWDVDDTGRARAHGEAVTGIVDYVNAVVFSPDGRFLFIGDGEETVRVLPLSIRAAIDYVCRATGELLTPALWHTYMPQLRYDPPCTRR